VTLDNGEFRNPFRPGAGHMPPYLAGREKEIEEFLRLLGQETILENMVLTGLRGVGKTVLLETLKPLAIKEGWLWVGTDLSESSSINEEVLAIRLLTDLSVMTSSIVISTSDVHHVGFSADVTQVSHTLNYQNLLQLYKTTPGLVSDKLKYILDILHVSLKRIGRRGVIFAYDEAQNLSDHAPKEQYPLSLLLDLFQSIQKKNYPFMLVLTGLPTLFPKLVEARTFAERMFRVVFLDKLFKEPSREAIVNPIAKENCPVTISEDSVDSIIEMSGGYPYFLQFICREVFDVFIQKQNAEKEPTIPIDEILRKLDTDFFAGRWARATDRQRELLQVIARLENSDAEFTVQEIVELSRTELEKPFGRSHVNQMLVSLTEAGLVYRNRHGRYSFAVPLLGPFILRQLELNFG
jgi:AAA+ ATPase superfamily predicted ATPase